MDHGKLGSEESHCFMGSKIKTGLLLMRSARQND